MQKLIIFAVVLVSVLIGIIYIPDISTTFKTKQGEEWRDFSRQFNCSPKYVHQPKTVQEVIKIVKNALEKGEKVRVVGGGYSMSPISLTSGHMINLDLMNKILNIDTEKKTVTVEAGIRIKDLNKILESKNLSLPNSPTIDLSIAGAISTGTHGTGKDYPSISNIVIGMELVNGNGDVVTINEELLPAARLSLGTFGIITSLTLQLESAQVIRREETNMRFDLLRDHFHTKVEQNEHCSFWWLPRKNLARYFVMNPIHKLPDDLIDVGYRSEISMKLEENISKKLLVLIFRALSNFPHLWESFFKTVVDLLHHRAYFDLSNRALYDDPLQEYLQETEYFVPMEDTTKVMNAIRDLFMKNEKIVSNGPILIRTIREDNTWLSPMYGRNSTGISYIYYGPPNKHFDVSLKEFEKLLVSLGGRPHWGKLHTKTYNDLNGMYEKLEEFLKIRKKFDPKNIFVNDYISKVFGI